MKNQTAILKALEESEHPDLSRRELADELEVPYQSVMSATLRLEKKGAIERSREIGNVQMFTLPEDHDEE